jgi:secreted PhoX family phosphatase
MVDLFFFDSWGRLWVTCDGNHLGAEAFGPSGFSRRADFREANLLPRLGETAWEAAERTGRLVRADDTDGWDTL